MPQVPGSTLCGLCPWKQGPGADHLGVLTGSPEPRLLSCTNHCCVPSCSPGTQGHHSGGWSDTTKDLNSARRSHCAPSPHHQVLVSFSVREMVPTAQENSSRTFHHYCVKQIEIPLALSVFTMMTLISLLSRSHLTFHGVTSHASSQCYSNDHLNDHFSNQYCPPHPKGKGKEEKEKA